MTCRIEQELGEIPRVTILAKMLRYFDSELDILLRMFQDIGDLGGEVIPFEALAECLRIRELVLEEALLVGQAQGPQPEGAHRPIVGRLLRIW